MTIAPGGGGEAAGPGSAALPGPLETPVTGQRRRALAGAQVSLGVREAGQVGLGNRCG